MLSMLIYNPHFTFYFWRNVFSSILSIQPLIEHVQGFTGSHWMPPLGKCLCRIAQVAAMVNKFIETTQNTKKTQLLASNYGTF